METKLKQLIGEIVFNNVVLQAQLEEANNKIAELTPKEDKKK